ncbi:hypothetical protein [Brucella tritici]|nr:hypothetical protein [Brucella tritici]
MLEKNGVEAPHISPIDWIEKLPLTKFLMLAAICGGGTYLVLSQLI